MKIYDIVVNFFFYYCSYLKTVYIIIFELFQDFHINSIKITKNSYRVSATFQKCTELSKTGRLAALCIIDVDLMTIKDSNEDLMIID